MVTLQRRHKMLAYADGDVILLDADGAGWGWHSDPRSPVAAGRIDLLSVLAHELGHVLGLGHDDDGVMGETLAPGVRSVQVAGSPAPLWIASSAGPRLVAAIRAAAAWIGTRRASPAALATMSRPRRSLRLRELGPIRRGAARERSTLQAPGVTRPLS